MVAGQAPVTLEWKNIAGKKIKANQKGYTYQCRLYITAKAIHASAEKYKIWTRKPAFVRARPILVLVYTLQYSHLKPTTATQETQPTCKLTTRGARLGIVTCLLNFPFGTDPLIQQAKKRRARSNQASWESLRQQSEYRHASRFATQLPALQFEHIIPRTTAY